MVIRATKEIFNKCLREAKPSDIAQIIANFLNAFFGEQHVPSTGKVFDSVTESQEKLI